MGFGDGPGSREKNRLRGGGPSRVITDLGILEPDPKTFELTMTYLHPGVDVSQAIENTGWELKVSPNLKTTKAPEQSELDKVRALVSTSGK